MTSGQHYHEAELILLNGGCDYGCPHAGCTHEMAYLARAQVHATLAIAAMLDPQVFAALLDPPITSTGTADRVDGPVTQS